MRDVIMYMCPTQGHTGVGIGRVCVSHDLTHSDLHLTHIDVTVVDRNNGILWRWRWRSGMTVQRGYYKHRTASATAKVTRAACTSPVPCTV